MKMKFKRQKAVRDSRGLRVAKTLMCAWFTFYSIALLFPFIYLIVVSLTDPNEYLTATEFLHVPSRVVIQNYIDAWNTLKVGDKGMLTMLFNSVWWSVGGAFLEIGTATCLGYAVARYKFFGRKAIHAVSLFTMLLPIYGSMPANMVMMNDLKLYNSPLILVTCCAGFGGTFIMTYAFFKSLPKAYMEAAFIDGAGHFKAFYKIMFPLAKGPIMALFIQHLITRWNDYMTPILYFPDYTTIPAGLYTYQIEQARGYNEPLLYSGMFLCMIPVLILYFLFNKQFMNLTIAGGLKG